MTTLITTQISGNNGPMMALVDCNNFFVSCERVANPDLCGRPVVVFSNNNGCIISRSSEAKTLGIKMGDAAFHYRSLLESKRVIGCTPQFGLYQRLSKAVIQVLHQFSPHVEPYSIDESFLQFEPQDRGEVLGPLIRDAVQTQTGLPVSIGFGATKTLAKLASDMAKSRPGNVMDFNVYRLIHLLDTIPVEEVWGIGRRTTRWLHRNGIETAGRFQRANPAWVQKKMGVIGHRIQMELGGISCFPVGVSIQAPSFYAQEAAQKSLLYSRSFPERITCQLALKKELIRNMTAACAKLRRARLSAYEVGFFFQTSRFDPHYESERWHHRFLQATNNENELVRHIAENLPKLIKPGRRYAKSGVYFNQLVPDNAVQLSFLTPPQEQRDCKLLATIDRVNARWGVGMISRGF